MDHWEDKHYPEKEDVVLDHGFAVVVVEEAQNLLVDMDIVVEQVEVLELVDAH
jgi:tetrahydromethanopterin S-methyltransferase subunit B